MELVADLTLVLVAALAGGLVARRIGQPLVVGYIVAGVLVGPFTGGLTVAHTHTIEQLAELGVALLLFSIGLEVSFRELAPVRAVALWGTALQLAVTIALGVGLAEQLGWPRVPAIWFGSLVALSSTMVVLKTLQAQGRQGTLSGRVMVGMLLVQDLAVVPLMIVLPELGASSGDPWRVALAVGRSLLLLGAIVVAAVWIVPRLMAAIARWNSRELFLLATLTVALGVGYAAWASGLSLALGAFVAGLVVNESDYAHRALSDIVPLRDLFGMLFFVSVGMLLDPVDVWRHAGEIALVVGAVLVVKATVFAAVVRLFGYRRVVPLAAGLTLFQVGEFAFVLARVGLTSGAITSDLYALVLNTAVATMALTPAVSALTPIVYERFSRRRQTRDAPEIVNAPPAGVASHVIVAGAGRVGRTVAQTLRAAGRPFVLIELDERRMRDARTAGLPIVYGDAAQPVILDAAGLDAAVALMVTVPAFPDVRQIVEVCRQRRPDLAIVARADSREAADALRALGVEEATSPELEAALAMTRSALARLGVDAGEIGRLLDAARRPQS